MHSKNTAILSGERYPAHTATAPRVHALAYIPLINRGRAIGVLTVGNLHQEREFTKRETRVLSALASYAASAIGNARLHERIAAERNQLHTIINQSDNPILVINHQHRLVVANQAARKLLGLPTGRIGGDPLGDLLRDRQLFEFITQKPDTGLVRHAHVQLSDGKTYRATLTPIKDVGRSVVMHRLGDA
jgi:GAF domain-containing protein